MDAPRIHVDLADMKVTGSRRGLLCSGGLGTGIAVSIYDPELHIGGLLHFVLPSSQLDPERARINPFFFADTGIPLLYLQAYALGSTKQKLICRLAGGGRFVNNGDEMPLGEQNLEAARQILARNLVSVHSECVGGIASASLALDLATGRLVVSKSNGEEVDL